MATNIPSPANMSDDDGGFSVSSTPTPGPSAGMRRTFSETPAHHFQGTSYFPTSPTAYRPTSPPFGRTSTSGSRYPRSTSSRPYRSTSVSTTSKVADDQSDKDGSGDDDDNDDDDDDNTPNASGAINNDGDDQEPREREFSEEDPLTVKARQLLINGEHPFGLPIWKPALYKKSRTVTRDAETELHSVPKATIDRHFIPGNIFWAVFFGWWLAIIFSLVAVVLWIVSFGGNTYSELVFGLSWYVCWPFGAYLEGDVENGTEGKVTNDVPEPEPLLQPSQTRTSSATIRGPSEIPGSSLETSDTESHVPLTTHSTHSTSTITPPRLRSRTTGDSEPDNERTGLFSRGLGKTYGIVDTPSEVATSTINALQSAIFWLFFISIIAPLLLVVTLVCWALVLTIPMAKLNWELLTHMWHRPRHIRFRSAPAQSAPPSPLQPTSTVNASQAAPIPSTRSPRLSAGQAAPQSAHSTVLLCTYRAAGLRYYKYTVGGVNIMFINLLPLVFFVIFDGLVLLPIAGHRKEAGLPLSGALALLTGHALIFILSLLSVIPLSYFIGMAVASISAQSSIGMGAVINATFGSIIEVILYGIALTQNKGRLVEGSIVGSVLAGVLLMPGLSMCGGALKKKEQKFNAKSANVTSTMLIMAIIGVLTPTMFYQVYGSFTLKCEGCPGNKVSDTWSCSQCYYEHIDPTEDPFYQNTVKAFMYFCAGILVLSYLIGLWFSLRTHASQIWQNPRQLMHPLDIGTLGVPGSNRLSLSNRLTNLGLMGSLPTHRLQRKPSQATTVGSLSGQQTRFQPIPALLTPRAPSVSDSQECPPRPLSPTQTRNIMNQVAFAPVLESVDHAVKSHGLEPQGNITTDDFTRAVAVATVSALRHQQTHIISPNRPRQNPGEMEETTGGHGGHDAPSWSRGFSASVLLGCTFLYAFIAEILIEVVDVVLEGSGIQEKFLGITLFALVPNTTEFMNAISFAMNGNISLSMEIGSAYALQVCLLQIPAMVAFSAWYHPAKETVANTFTLIFPRWDVITMVLSIFLLTYTYIEAKANYHRGSILVFSYLVLGAGFYFAPPLVGEAEVTTFSADLNGPIGSYPRALYTFLFAR